MIGQIYGERKFKTVFIMKPDWFSKQTKNRVGGEKQRDKTLYRFSIGSKIFSEFL